MEETLPHKDFYQVLRARIRDWLALQGPQYRHAQVLLLAPDLFHLLTRLVIDPRVPAAEKARLGAIIAYFVSPLDLFPEALVGPVGYADDVALAAYGLHGLINAGHGAVAKELWAGDGDLLDALQKALHAAEEAVGSGVWARIKTWFGRL